MRFSPAEMLALAALLAVSGALFWVLSFLSRPHPRSYFRSNSANESHSPASSPRTRECRGVLGFLRVCPRHRESPVHHDPCYLGRYRNVYDPPREPLAAAGQLINPPRSRESSFCCGAGGGLAFLGEETGTRVSHNRAPELAATGADIVAAACPFCNTMFRDALPAVSSAPPQLLDIASLPAK
jgi:hypothetical protein